MRANCERLGDTFTGAALLFCAVAAVVAFGGLWMGEPLFTVSSAFALTAAAAFGIGCADDVARGQGGAAHRGGARAARLPQRGELAPRRVSDALA